MSFLVHNRVLASLRLWLSARAGPSAVPQRMPDGLEKRMMKDKSNRLTTYLHVSLVALLAALLLRLAIQYFETGRVAFPADDMLFIVLWVSILLAFLLFHSLATILFKCAVCGRFSHDSLIFRDGPSRRFCREHLIEAFRQEFTACAEKMVVVYPALEMKRGPYVYEYRPIEDIPEQFLQSPPGRLFSKALSSLGNKCGRCSRNGTVAYFGPGNTPWESLNIRGKGWDDYQQAELPATFQITCPDCIVDELCYSLSRFEGAFSEGVILPHNGSGIFMSRLR